MAKNEDNKKILVLKRPRITEKSSMLAERLSYTFDVTKDATKADVKEAVRELYKVDPKKVNIIKVPSKKVFRRGGHGRTAEGKKAVVILNEGDKIEFV